MQIWIVLEENGVEVGRKEVTIDEEARVHDLMGAVKEAFENVPADQELRFDDKQLNPDKTLKDYDLKDGSTVTLKSVKLTISIVLREDGAQVGRGDVTIDEGAEVYELMGAAKERFKILPADQELRFVDEKLAPHKTLKYYNLKDDSTVTLTRVALKQLGLRIELHDEQNRMHGGHDFLKIQAEATVQDLLDVVGKDGGQGGYFPDKPRFLRLYFRGKQLDPADNLKKAGIPNHGRIGMRHRLLSTWVTYLEQANKYKEHSECERQMSRRNQKSDKEQARDDKMKAYRALSDALKVLDGSKFFFAYTEFSKEREKRGKLMRFLLHTDSFRVFERSVDTFFKIHFPGKKMEFVVPVKKTSGVQLACIVDLEDTDNQTKESYYAKTLGNIGSDAEKPKVDLLELFVYELFHLMGIGADRVFIIPDSHRSGCVYVATKMIKDFYTADGNYEARMRDHKEKLEKKVPEVNEEDKKTSTAQLNGLMSLFCLIDLGISNEANYGFVKRSPTKEEIAGGRKDDVQELRVVDFRVDFSGPKSGSRSGSDSKAKEKLISPLGEYFTKWNLKDNIGKAKAFVMDDEAIKSNENADGGPKENLEKYIQMIEGWLGWLHEREMHDSIPTRKRAAEDQEGEEEKEGKRKKEGEEEKAESAIRI